MIIFVMDVFEQEVFGWSRASMRMSLVEKFAEAWKSGALAPLAFDQA